MERNIYLIKNYDIDNAIAVNLTDEQVSAINWFIEWADVDFGIETIEDGAIDI